jgi:23S rRNA-/tRNA-specific pseudouridylate synthase
LEYTVIKRYDKFTLLKIKLLTGRYHQIRAQMAHIGHPIVGDVFYGSNVHLSESKILLHACQLRFKAPPTNDWITVEHMPEWESD